jgi:hypothetical protein
LWLIERLVVGPPVRADGSRESLKRARKTVADDVPIPPERFTTE